MTCGLLIQNSSIEGSDSGGVEGFAPRAGAGVGLFGGMGWALGLWSGPANMIERRTRPVKTGGNKNSHRGLAYPGIAVAVVDRRGPAPQMTTQRAGSLPERPHAPRRARRRRGGRRREQPGAEHAHDQA